MRSSERSFSSVCCLVLQYVLLSTVASCRSVTSCGQTGGAGCRTGGEHVLLEGPLSDVTHKQGKQLLQSDKASSEAMETLWQTTEETDVFMTQLFGTLEVSDNLFNSSNEILRENVIAHIFLKALHWKSLAGNATEDNGAVYVKGLWFVESLDNPPDTAHFSEVMTPLAASWKPRIFLKEVQTDVEWEFDLSHNRCEVRRGANGVVEHVLCAAPFMLNLTVPNRRDFENVEFEIGIADWARPVVYKGVVTDAETNVHPVKPKFWIVSKEPFLQGSVDAQLWVESVLYNIQYHIPLGFSGIQQYMELDTLKLVIINPIIMELVKRGFLQLIVWNKVLACTHHERCGRRWVGPLRQYLQANHALMANMGTNTVLAPIDLDEFLAISEPHMTVQDAYSKCFESRTYAVLRRLNVVPKNGCKAEGDWKEHWAPCSFQRHPLEAYQVHWKRHDVSQKIDGWHISKFWVYPDSSGPIAIHGATLDAYGDQFNPDYHEEHVDQVCAFWMHVNCMYRHREGVLQHPGTQENGVPQKWKWVLDEIDPLVGGKNCSR